MTNTNEERCKECGRVLSGDDKPLTKKLINRGATEFYCADCLARYFKVDRKLIDERAKFFRENGCTLFS